jgi:zinc/manganese transport system permease protein
VAIIAGYDYHDWQTFGWSLGFTVAGAVVFTLTRTRDQRVPQEALIGIVYVVAAAAGILLLSRSAHGDEELRRTLVGEILLVQPAEIGKTFAAFAVIGVLHWAFRRQFLALSYGPEPPRRARWWDFVFYLLFGLAVTSFVLIGGVLLTFSYLIVPAVCANFLAERIGARLLAGWLVATLASVAGLIGSYRFDLPTGAALVCALGLMLALVVAVLKWRGRR